MIIYCSVLFALIFLFITTFHYKKDFYINLDKETHPLKHLYGLSFVILSMTRKSKKNTVLSLRETKLKEKLSKLYSTVPTDDLLLQYKLKSITSVLAIILAISFIGFTYSFSLSGEDANIQTIERSTDSDDKSKVELIADIDGETTNVTLEIDSKEYSIEEALAYFDKHRDNIELSILGNNKDLYNITQNLVFNNKYEDISISWDVENSEYVDYDGHIFMENIPDDGVVTSIFATLSYKGRKATISIPIFIKKTLSSNETSSTLESKLQSYIDSQDKYTSSIDLPTEIDGKTVKYYKNETSSTLSFF